MNTEKGLGFDNGVDEDGSWVQVPLGWSISSRSMYLQILLMCGIVDTIMMMLGNDGLNW